MILVLFIFITIYWYTISKDKKSVAKYTKVTSILFFLFAGLRNEAFYSDTYGYIQNFYRLGDMSVREIIWHWPKDSFFYIFTHYLHPIIFHNYTLWLLLISALYIYPTHWLIKKYSPNPMISWWCFAFIGLMMFVMQGLRQTMAMGIVLCGFIFLLKDKNMYFFLSIALAFLFHATSLVFLVVYPLTKLQFKFNKNTIILYIAALILVLVYGTTIQKGTIEVLSQHDERYAAYGETLNGSTWTYTLQQVVLIVPTLYFCRYRFHEKKIALLSHISVLALVIVTISPVIAEMYRLSMYFSWTEILFFPIALEEAKKYGYKNMQTLFVMFAFFYLLYIGTLKQPYLFFFQDASDYISRTFIWL